MLRIKEYVPAESLAQAYELNQIKNNRILGGTGWLKMGEHSIGRAIDLMPLAQEYGLDHIEEDEQEIRIGCMVTLRQLEKSEVLAAYTAGAVRESVRHIVGTQFRNCATVGGSIFGRFGFSDVLTLFLVMDCEVALYQGGRIPLTEFAEKKADRDILLHLIVQKSKLQIAYQSFRNQSTDFPVLTCGAALAEDGVRLAIGARPAKAQRHTYPLTESLCDAEIERIATQAVTDFTYGSNMRASAEYREKLARVLTRRALTELMSRGEGV